MTKEKTEERNLRPPAVDIYESGEGMLLLADLPGVTGDSLDLRVERNRLTIRGRIPATPEGARKHLDETWEGDFFREFQISEDLDAGDVRATLEHGVLRLEIPKSKKLQSRRIEIRTK